MRTSSTQLTIRLSQETLSALRAEAIRSRSSVSEVIADLLRVSFPAFISYRVERALHDVDDEADETLTEGPS